MMDKKKRYFLKNFTHYEKLFYLFLLTNILSASQHNFYIGVNAGIAGITAKRDDATLNNSPLYQSLTNNKTVNNKSGLAGIFIGYLFRFENLGIGPELFAEYENLESAIEEKYTDPHAGPDEETVSIKYKLTGPFGINLKFGYFLCNNFIYALFGWQKQKLRYEANLKNVPLGGPARPTGVSCQTKNRYINGINLGLGAQRQINENYTIGFELKIAKAPTRNFETNFGDQQETFSFNSLHAIRTYSCSLRFMYTF